MSGFRPRIEDATDANVRMDALCEFIEFWLGPRQASYGEPLESLAAHDLPMPLRRLYTFAGRWPAWDKKEPMEYVVPAFAVQDSLVALHSLKPEQDGKIAFLYENQGVWDCRTLVQGEDPPVWCYGDQMDETGSWFTGEKAVSNSLTRFLTTFVLQEISLGSRLYLCDEGLDDLYASQQDSVIPVWTQGQYVHGSIHNYYLWNHVLVAELWSNHFFCANDEEGVRFLTENQGPIEMIGVMMGQPWTLDIRSDGSARLRYLRGQTDESIEAPARTFDFPGLLELLPSVAVDQGHYERNAMVFFHRRGQSGGVRGRHLHDAKYITSLFEMALKEAVRPTNALKRRFKDEWPL